MNSEAFGDHNADLEPSAEDLEIFAELDREQVERQARIDRGEPAVDPMVSSSWYYKISSSSFQRTRPIRLSFFLILTNCRNRHLGDYYLPN